MTKRLKDDLETLSKWRTVIQNLSEEAAPTPPAPEGGNWINADEVNALVRQLDVLLNGEEDAARQASLCDIVAQVSQLKAQEDEPVAYKITTRDGMSFQFMIVGHPMEKELLDEAVQLGMPIIPLYTRPADDKLRKAAEEYSALTEMANLHFQSKEHAQQHLDAKWKLRAALARKPTPSDTDKPSPA